jgi:glycosyltransferase involved in cell wall biosynthesis
MRIVTADALNRFRVFTISEFSSAEISKYFKLKNKIPIVYAGSPIPKKPKSGDQASVERKFGINGHDYLFYLGLLVPHKNILNIIYSFSKVSDSYPSLMLVLAGKKRPDIINVELLINKLDLKSRVILTGPVSENEKYFLFKGAKIFLFPSFHEGFGIPILESQSFGVPVITSGTTSLPEVTGRGGLFVDPNSPDEISQSIIKIMTDRNVREKIIHEGYKNLERFSWDKSATEALDLMTQNPD